MATFKLRANELSGETGLTVQLYPPGGTIANGAGGDTLTESSGLFTATVAESLAGFHQYYVYQSSLPIYSGFVYCNGSTWYADRPESRILTLNPASRSASDVNPILFWWPVASDTFTSKTVTITENGTTGSSANVQGAITATGESVVDTDGRTMYLYTLGYDADDRPSGEGVAQYVLTGTGYVGYLTLEVSPSLANLQLIGTGNGILQAGSVASNGSIAQIVIGDDYLAANGRAFEWTITEPTGFTAASSTVTFGIRDKDGNTFTQTGTITDQGSTWKLSVDVPNAKTSTLVCGPAEWSVEVASSGVKITTIRQSTDDEATQIVERYT